MLAKEASPTGDAHGMAGYFMPSGVKMFHSGYDGDAAECDCAKYDHTDGNNHKLENGTHSTSEMEHNMNETMSNSPIVKNACQFETSYPLFCTEMLAKEASPTGDAHGMAGYFMPSGVKMFHSGYDGDAAECDCAKSDHTDGNNHNMEGDHEHEHDHVNSKDEINSMARLQLKVSSALYFSALMFSINLL